MIIEYHPAVGQELEKIRDHYEEKLPGLGREFISEFERQVLRIAAAPERWMVAQGNIRRALMNRFPYVIYFCQPSPEKIRVTIVKHQRRHPHHGMDRK